MEKVFKEMKFQEEKMFSVSQLADLTGPVKMLLYENYRNEFEGTSTDLKKEDIDFDSLIKKTIEGNKTSKALRDEIEQEGFNSCEKSFVGMDAVDLFKCGPDSKAIKGLELAYGRDDRFIKFLNNVNKVVRNVNQYPSKESYLKALNQYRQTYYVVIGGNTRMAILYQMYKENRQKADKDGSAKAFKVKFAIIDYNRLMKKFNCDMSNYYGQSERFLQLYHDFHYASLRLLIYKDNERERGNMTDSSSLSGLATITEYLVKCQSFFTNNNENLDLRELEACTKVLWGEVSTLKKGWMTQSTAFNLANQAQIQKKKTGNLKREYTTEELENYAKVLTTTIGAKYVKALNLSLDSEKIEEFCGIDFKNLKIKNEKVFWEIVELTTTLKEQKTDSPASYLKDIIREVFASRKSGESWVLTDEERKEMVDKVGYYKKNNSLDHETSEKILSSLMSMRDSANQFGIIQVGKDFIEQLLTLGNAQAVIAFMKKD